MLSRLLVITLIFFSSLSVSAGEYEFCLLINNVKSSGGLNDYSNKQIENGLCMATKEIMDAMINGNTTKEAICTKSAEYMLIEFKKRFPGRAASSVSGKC
ncbi:MAG: hypothetical protein ACMZ63_06500 [Methylotenera sp.]